MHLMLIKYEMIHLDFYHHHHITTVLRHSFLNHPDEPGPEESFLWTLWC